MLNIAFGIILALIIIGLSLVIVIFLWSLIKAGGEEVSSDGFGQKVLDSLVFLIKSPVTYFKYLAPIIILATCVSLASFFGDTAAAAVYLGGGVAVFFYYSYLKEKGKSNEKAK